MLSEVSPTYLFAVDPFTQAQPALEAGHLLASRVVFKPQPEVGAMAAVSETATQQSPRKDVRVTPIPVAHRLDVVERGDEATEEPDRAVAREKFVKSPRLGSANETKPLLREVIGRSGKAWGVSMKSGLAVQMAIPLNPMAQALHCRIERVFERQHVHTQAARERQFPGNLPAAPKVGMR